MKTIPNPSRESDRINTGVCEKNTPPEKKTRGRMSFQSTRSGGRAVSAAALQGKSSHKTYSEELFPHNIGIFSIVNELAIGLPTSAYQYLAEINGP